MLNITFEETRDSAPRYASAAMLRYIDDPLKHAITADSGIRVVLLAQLTVCPLDIFFTGRLCI